VEVNRTVRSVRRRLGKDDAIDAEAAARHTWRVQPLLHPKPGPTRWR
jgi:hypothetical protein